MGTRADKRPIPRGALAPTFPRAGNNIPSFPTGLPQGLLGVLAGFFKVVVDRPGVLCRLRTKPLVGRLCPMAGAARGKQHATEEATGQSSRSQPYRGFQS